MHYRFVHPFPSRFSPDHLATHTDTPQYIYRCNLIYLVAFVVVVKSKRVVC